MAARGLDVKHLNLVAANRLAVNLCLAIRLLLYSLLVFFSKCDLYDFPTDKQVVNYDCPNHYEDYVHRCGRTGRAGNKVPHSP